MFSFPEVVFSFPEVRYPIPVARFLVSEDRKRFHEGMFLRDEECVGGFCGDFLNSLVNQTTRV